MDIRTGSDTDRLSTAARKSPCGRQFEGVYGGGGLARAYRTALAVLAILAVVNAITVGLPGLLGIAYGAGISLLSLYTLEWGVLRFLRPGAPFSQVRLAALLILKLPFLITLLAPAAWMAVNHVANVFAMVAGMALVPGVIIWHGLEDLLVSLLPPAPEPQRQPAATRRSPVRPVRRLALNRNGKH